MIVPSWFSTSNDLSTILRPPPGAKLSYERRCADTNNDSLRTPDTSLYLLFCSVLQDLRNFKHLPCSPISGFKKVTKATQILYDDLRDQGRNRNCHHEKCDRNLFTRLSCILLLGVVAYQSSINNYYATLRTIQDTLSGHQSSSDLSKLDAFLRRHENVMQSSVCGLRKVFFDMFVKHLGDQQTAEYVAFLTNGISLMSADMCHEIENAILLVLLRDE